MSMISRLRTDIREVVGEPAIHAKYTDARLLSWIERGYAHVLGELNRRSADPIVVRHDIPFVAGRRIYQLPPIVQRVFDLELIDGDGNRLWYLHPRSRWNPAGFGVAFESNTLRLSYDPDDSTTLRVHFVPSGCVKLHTGTITDASTITPDSTTAGIIAGDDAATPTTIEATTAVFTADMVGSVITFTSGLLDTQSYVIAAYVDTTHVTITLDVTAVALNDTFTIDTSDGTKCTLTLKQGGSDIGTIDLRPNAYAGSTLRILTAADHNYEQMRTIDSYDVTTKQVVLKPGFDHDLLPAVTVGTAGVTYEICPPLAEHIDYALAVFVAMQIAAMEGDATRYQTIIGLWRDAIRDAVLQHKDYNAMREGAHMDTRFRSGIYSRGHPSARSG